MSGIGKSELHTRYRFSPLKNYTIHIISFVCTVAIVLLFNAPLQAQTQLIHLPDGTYIDTTGKMDTTCTDLGIYYFQVGAKHPMSSDTLLKKLNATLGPETGLGKQSGWITFQFMIDCEGKLVKRVRLVQTDANYKAAAFPMNGIYKLYQFVLGLDGWKHATLPSNITHPYHTFLSFKINHGKVERIIP